MNRQRQAADLTRQFDEQGYTIVRGLIPRPTCDALLERIDGLLDGRYPPGNLVVGAASEEGETDPGRHIRQVMAFQYPISDPVLEAWRTEPLLREIASTLLRTSEPVVFQQQALVKHPGLDNGTPWHQDDHYWQFEGRSALTAWMPLTSASAANGTMWLLPGSHTQRLLAHQSAADGASKFQEVAEPFDTASLVPLELEPGDVSFHHKTIVHGAYANTGSARRVSVVQHYVSSL